MAGSDSDSHAHERRTALRRPGGLVEEPEGDAARDPGGHLRDERLSLGPERTVDAV